MPDNDHRISLIRFCAGALLLAFYLPSAFVHALQDDNDQPIHIVADKALRDEKQGITIYSGNVVMTQGSMKLEGATVTIYHTQDNNVEKAVAEGNPAKMQQQPDPEKAIVYGHGKVVTYYGPESKVHLQTDAYIDQDGAVVTGNSIDYLLDDQVITAESNQSQKDDKVIVVIPPNVQHKETRNGATPSK
jgi:lipopolysaccharide export system protein LptA